MIHLLEARWEHRVHLSDSANSGNYNRIGFHYLLHAHHGLHHCGHLLFYGLHFRPSSSLAPPLLHPLL
ncbi:hypothetical protein GmHk_12G035268 [Glycine max]|nr:hypothetical protein GmHk_12G035268 [Glycine max]